MGKGEKIKKGKKKKFFAVGGKKRFHIILKVLHNCFIRTMCAR